MVTIYSDGTAAFVMRYTRPSAKRVFMPLGSYGRDGKAGLSLKDACDKHDEWLKLLEPGGLDPIDEAERRVQAEERERHEREGADTVFDLAERFVQRELKDRKRPAEAAALLGYVDPSRSVRPRKGKRRNVQTLVSELGSRKVRDVRPRYGGSARQYRRSGSDHRESDSCSHGAAIQVGSRPRRCGR